jgi:hypothetical protein
MFLIFYMTPIVFTKTYEMMHYLATEKIFIPSLVLKFFCFLFDTKLNFKSLFDTQFILVRSVS